MATSGVYSFSPNTYEIIAGALRLVGAIQTGETPPADEYDDCLRALNGLIKSWQVNGLHVWTQETYTITPIVGQALYVLGIGSGAVEIPRPLKLTAARLNVTSTQDVVPLIPMSRLDYANLSDKTIPTGTPAQWFYDPQLPFGELTLYPAPSATTYTIQIVGQRPLQDFVAQSDTADVPQEWVSALRFALAVEIAPEYDCPADRLKVLKTLADEKLQVVQAWDLEAQGTTTQAFSQAVYQIIARAMRLCGACGPQDVPRYGQVQNAFYALNMMVKAWQGSGIHVWAEQDATLFVQPVQIAYQLGSGSPDHATLTSDWTQTSLAATAVASDFTFTLDSVADVAVGDQIGIWLDNGYVFWSSITVIAGSVVTTADALTSLATSGAQVVTYTTALVRPLRVNAMRSYQFRAPDGQPIETPMAVMSRLDYSFVPNKQTPGQTTQFFYDPRRGTGNEATGIVYLWPAPQIDNQRACKFTMQRPLLPFENLSDIGDFPAEWTSALTFNLAIELWPEYEPIRAKVEGARYSLVELAAQALDKLTTAQGFDREPEAIYFGLENMPASRN